MYVLQGIRDRMTEFVPLKVINTALQKKSGYL